MIILSIDMLTRVHISRTRTTARSPARAPIINRASSLSPRRATSDSRSSHERLGDFDSATYTHSVGFPGLSYVDSEQASIVEDPLISLRGFEIGPSPNTIDITGTDLIQRGRHDNPGRGTDMATATMTSPHAAMSSGHPGGSRNGQHGHTAYNVAAGPIPNQNGSSGSAPPRARGQRQVGDWILGKTIGAGSMGKVKIVVHQHTREKVSKV